jgi:energy-coupling factor transporter ATP-binding protein EcfA2
MVVWPCYEPPGQRIGLTEEHLLQHTLVLGSTGSGKSTLLISAIRQLLRWPGEKIGLLILDAKQDETVPRIREMARHCGRAGDLVVLGPQGGHSFELFGLRSFGDVETLTQRLMLTDPVGGDNPYWRTTTANMVSAALTLLVAAGDGIQYDQAVNFMRQWFASSEATGVLPKSVAGAVEKARRKLKKTAAACQLRGALDHVEVWSRLDSRTRSNLQSCLLNVLSPLLSDNARSCFAASARPTFTPAQVARESRVCIVSVNALAQPDLARLFFGLARKEFFDAVQMRGAGPHPLCGLVADEFPLIARPEDAEQLATLRSRRCFVLAASQGLAAMDECLGPRRRRAIMVNFNTLIFLRTREEEAEEFATRSLGICEAPASRQVPDWLDGQGISTLPLDSKTGNHPRLVCPPGALGCLQSHQGYVVGSDGSRTLRPVWFVPWFEQDQNDAPIESVTRCGAKPFSARHVLDLMRERGLIPLLSAEVLAAATQLPSRFGHPDLQKARAFFQKSQAGLVPEAMESLPARWLAGLPGILWSLRRPRWTHLPFTINRVACQNGVLILGFEHEPAPTNARFTLWDEVRLVTNRSLYPSRWRALSRRHRLELCLRHPNLRPALADTEMEVS